MLRVGALGRRVAAHPRAAVQYALGPWRTLCRSYSSINSHPESPVSKNSQALTLNYFRKLQDAILDLSTTPLSIKPIKAEGSQKVHIIETVDNIASLFSKILGNLDPETRSDLTKEYQGLLQVRPLTGACALLLCCELKLAAAHIPDTSRAQTYFEEVRGLLPKFTASCSTSSSMSELTLIFWMQPYLLGKQTRNLHKQQPKHFATLKQLNSSSFLARIAHRDQRLPEGVAAALGRAVFERGCLETKQIALTILTVLSLESYSGAKPGTVALGRIADLLHNLLNSDPLEPTACDNLGSERISSIWNSSTHLHILELADFESTSKQPKLKLHEIRGIINYLELATSPNLEISPAKTRILEQMASLRRIVVLNIASLSIADATRFLACTQRNQLTYEELEVVAEHIRTKIDSIGYKWVVRSAAESVSSFPSALRDYYDSNKAKDEISLRAVEFLGMYDGFVGVLNEGRSEVLGLEQLLQLATITVREFALGSASFRKLAEYLARILFSWRHKLTLPELVQLQNLIIDLHLQSTGGALPKHTGQRASFQVGLEWEGSLSPMAAELERMAKHLFDLKVRPQHLSPRTAQDAFVRVLYFDGVDIDRKGFLVSTKNSDGSESNIKEMLPKGLTRLSSPMMSEGIKALEKHSIGKRLEYRCGLGSRTPYHAKPQGSEILAVLVLNQFGVRGDVPKCLALTGEEYSHRQAAKKLMEMLEFNTAVYILRFLHRGFRVVLVREEAWATADPTFTEIIAGGH